MFRPCLEGQVGTTLECLEQTKRPWGRPRGPSCGILPSCSRPSCQTLETRCLLLWDNVRALFRLCFPCCLSTKQRNRTWTTPLTRKEEKAHISDFSSRPWRNLTSHMGDPHGNPQTGPHHADPHGFLVWFSLERHQVHVDRRVVAGLRVAMWITHVGGKFRHGLLEKSLNINISFFALVRVRLTPGQPAGVNRTKSYVGPATTQNLVVKFDGEICGGVLVENVSDDFPQQKKFENLLPNFAGSSPPISLKTSPTSLWKSLVLSYVFSSKRRNISVFF